MSISKFCETFFCFYATCGSNSVVKNEFFSCLSLKDTHIIGDPWRQGSIGIV